MMLHHTSIAVALSLAAFNAAPAVAQDLAQDLGSGRALPEPAEETSVRMPLVIEQGQRWSWSVRRNSWDPLAAAQAQPEEGGVGLPGAIALRFDLVAEKPKEDGAWLLALKVSPLGLNGRQDTEQETGAGGAPPLAFAVQIDANGIIERLKPRQHEGADNTEGIAEPVVSFEELRVHLGAIFGAGLHGRTLTKGEVYPLGKAGARQPILAGDQALAKAAGLAAVLLRLDAVREVRGERVAAFSLLQPDEQPVGDELGRAVGEATYTAGDGLLRSFTYKPHQAESRERTSVDWLVIERIEE